MKEQWIKKVLNEFWEFFLKKVRKSSCPVNFWDFTVRYFNFAASSFYFCLDDFFDLILKTMRQGAIGKSNLNTWRLCNGQKREGWSKECCAFWLTSKKLFDALQSFTRSLGHVWLRLLVRSWREELVSRLCILRRCFLSKKRDLQLGDLIFVIFCFSKHLIRFKNYEQNYKMKPLTMTRSKELILSASWFSSSRQIV